MPPNFPATTVPQLPMTLMLSSTVTLAPISRPLTLTLAQRVGRPR